MLTAKKVLFFKNEAVEGVAETMDPAVDGVLVLEGGNVTPSGAPVGSKRLSETLSKSRDTIGQLALGIVAPCEFRGGGIDGSAVNAPDFDRMLQACAMVRSDVEFLAVDEVTGTFAPGEVITGGTSSATGLLIANVGGGLLYEPLTGTFESGETVTGGDSSASVDTTAAPITGYQYKPTSASASMKSATGVMYLDGHKWTMTGARGTFTIDLPAAEKPTIEFTMNGRWNPPEQVSNPTPTLLDTAAPLVQGMGLKVGSHAPLGVTSISIDMANVVSKAMDVNASDGIRCFQVLDREPTGSFDPEAESLSVDNPFADWTGSVLAEMSFLLGSVAGNRIYVSMPKIQKDTPGYGDLEGKVTYDQSFKLKKDAGDDELRLVFF